jgi:MFS family permease
MGLLRSRIDATRRQYPNQFWLLFWGLMISTVGSSMIWPFLMIYVNRRLNLPLATATTLMSVNAICGLVFAFIAGPVTDRLGRKWVMAVSLAATGLGYLMMSQANSFFAFVFIMAWNGSVQPLYRVGADAMMADLIPSKQRVDAYSLLRTSNNIGVALGPAIGGFIAGRSYTVAFLLAAAGLITYSLLVTFLANETLPRRDGIFPRIPERLGGYDRVLKDRKFVVFSFNYTLTQICAALIWVLLGVYAYQNFHVTESQYGFIPTTNALMVVFFQLIVTRISKRYPPLRVLAVGTLFYALGVGSVAFGQGFWGFWLSMVIVTIGELITAPTATTLVANLAPADMRGRYMSIYGLTWGAAAGIGPVLGGLLNDNFGPVYIWYGGLVIGLISVLGFILIARRFPKLRISAA